MYMKKSVFLIIVSVLFASCSSAPKRPMLVTEISDQASVIYQQANVELLKGQYDQAGKHLENAFNLALSVDDCDLLCHITLSQIIYKISAKKDLYFQQFSLTELLETAETFALSSRDKEKNLSLCRIYSVKADLSKKESSFDSKKAINELKLSQEQVSKDPYYLAFLNRTFGEVYEKTSLYSEAEKAYLESAQIHLKERFLFEIGLDYYSAARMNSLMNNLDKSLEYLDLALKYDKDAENTGAIAADYFACALIYSKKGDEAGRKTAKKFAERAAAIYGSGGFDEEKAGCIEFASKL